MSWKKVKLGDLLKQYRIEHRVDDKITYKQVSILNDGSVVLRGEKIGKEIGRKRQFIIDTKKYPNTLIFTRQLLLQGSIGIASDNVCDCIVTENMPMFSIDITKIDKEFLILFLKSEIFKSRIREIELSGSAQKSIHERTFLNLEFLLPPFELQKEIVVELLKLKSKSDNISTELTHQLDLVKKLRQQLLQDAVQGKLVEQNQSRNLSGEPASELLKKIKAEKVKLIAEKNPSTSLRARKEKELPPIKTEEIPFEIPENWIWCRLGEIAEIGTGGTPLTSNSDYYENGNIPWITSSATNNLFVLEPELYITEKALKETNCKLYPTGTLVVAMYGQGKTRGQITELNFPAATNQACATITLFFNEFTFRKYVKLFFQKIYNEIRELAQGGAQPNLNMGKIRDTIIPIPPLSEQHRIVQKLDELMQYCNELEASIKQSQQQNEKLLQQVLREALREEGKE